MGDKKLNNSGYCKKHNAYFDKDIGYCIFCKTEALERKFKELEDVVSPAYVKTICDKREVAHDKQIAGLKESLNEVAQGRIGWEENIEEVLRELFQRMGDNEDLSKLGYDLLEKLDVGSARQTEEKEPNLCDSCKLWVANFDPEGNECENYMKVGCPKLKEKLPETEPEKYPKVVYQLGTDSKEYMELKKKYDKLIEEIQDDLDSLNPGVPYQYEPLNIIKKKWQGMIK